MTVTHPEMRRYFMTIPEAVQLVLQAGALGKGGELFMLDMGEPVKVVDLARDLIRLSGLVEGEDIEIEFTGIRPGEKLYEEMFFSDELAERTEHPKVLRARKDAIETWSEHLIDQLIHTAAKGDMPREPQGHAAGDRAGLRDGSGAGGDAHAELRGAGDRGRGACGEEAE